MKNGFTIRGLFGRLTAVAAICVYATGCAENPYSQDMLPSPQLDLSIEVASRKLSRTLDTNLSSSTESFDGTDAGVWVRSSNLARDWSVENHSVDIAENRDITIWCDALEAGAKEIYAASPYSNQSEIVDEAFHNRATLDNISGLYYKVSPDGNASDLAVGGAVTTSSAIGLRLNPVLAKVGFAVSVRVDGQAPTITIPDEVAAGTFDVDGDNRLIINSVSLHGNFYGEGVVNMLSCNWAVPNSTGDYLFGTDYIGTETPSTPRIETFTLTSGDFFDANHLQPTADGRYPLNNRYFYLIPQDCADADAVRFEVNYTLINPSGISIDFTETSPYREMSLVAGETTIFDIVFDFSTISFRPTVVGWH